MKTLSLVTAVFASDAVPSTTTDGQNNVVAQCGSNVPNFTDKCGDLVSPPTCAEDEACYTEDGCYYSCVKKYECQANLYNGLLEDGKLLCNCEKEPSFKYSWTCDFVNEEHGHAFMPPIEKNLPLG